MHGDNVAGGCGKRLRRASARSARRWSARRRQRPKLLAPDRDSGFVSNGELFIVGRIKDLLIVYGRNHSPEDIEMTIQDVIASRCAAIAVPDKETEKLVVIIELTKRGPLDTQGTDRLRNVRRDVTSAISKSRGLSVADLVLVFARLDPDHHQRQDQTIPVRRALSAGQVHETRCLVAGRGSAEGPDVF